jgi:hypothetical protein
MKNVYILQRLFFLILYFLSQSYLISAQNLTIKRINHPGSSRVGYEYQILPNGTNHGYFKEYSIDGILVLNYTYKYGTLIKGIQYFQDGKTVKHEFNQDDNSSAHGTQRVNAFSKKGQLYTQHISVWNHGQLVSAQTLSNPTDIRFKYDNRNVIRYHNVKGTPVIFDKFNIDANNLITGYFRENDVNLHFSRGLLTKVTLADDSLKTFFTRISKDTLLRMYDINVKDSSQLFYYYFDTTKLKVLFSFNDKSLGIDLVYIGKRNYNIIKYDDIEGHLENYVFNDGRTEYESAEVKQYKYPNYPDTSGSYLYYWEVKNKGNSDVFKSRKWFFKNGELEQHELYKRLINGLTEVLIYDGAGTLIDKR